MRVHAEYVQQLTDHAPIMHIREGGVAEQVLQLINEAEEISMLVLGADTKSDSAGPVISYLVGKGIFRMPRACDDYSWQPV